MQIYKTLTNAFLIGTLLYATGCGSKDESKDSWKPPVSQQQDQSRAATRPASRPEPVQQPIQKSQPVQQTLDQKVATAPAEPASRPSQPAQPKQNTYEQRLRNASSIVIDEDMGFGKNYSILVGGKKVASVRGKAVRMWGGDVFTLTTVDGKVLGYEREHKRRFFKLNRAASVYDANDKLQGYFGEEKFRDGFRWGYIFHFYDEKKQEIGESDKRGKSAWNRHKLKDEQGNIDYDINKHATLGNDKYTLTVKDKKSAIPVEFAILMTCVEDVIGDNN